MDKIKPKGSARLFNSRLLEMLTRSNPVIILAMYVPLCAFLLWYFHQNINPSIGILIGVFFAGMFSWTLTEYVLHRYAFHFHAEKPRAQRMIYLVHGVHHEYPRDKQRLIMPPVPSIVLAGVFFLIFRLIFGSFSFVFFSGFLIGYLAYVMVHYATHAFRPPRNMFRFLWNYHSLHHYKCPDKAYGVSSPLWDYVFRTMPPAEDMKKIMSNRNRIDKV